MCCIGSLSTTYLCDVDVDTVCTSLWEYVVGVPLRATYRHILGVVSVEIVSGSGPHSLTLGTVVPLWLVDTCVTPVVVFADCASAEMDVFHSVLFLYCGKCNELVHAVYIVCAGVVSHGSMLVEPVV